MRKNILLFAIIFFATPAISQDFYISLNNEVVKGKIINYKEWVKNPSSVQFQEASTGKTVDLTPMNCKGFTADSSDIYVSYSGTRILNSTDIENTHALQSDVLTRDSVKVFLREIYSFKNYILYKLADDKRINFYLSDNGVIKELEYYEYMDENKHISFDYSYKNYLLLLFSNKDVAGLDHKIELLNYQETSLVNFFADALKDRLHASEKLRNKYPAETFIGAGAIANFGSLTNASGKAYQQTAISPSFDIGLRLYSQRNFGKLFFQPSINVTALTNGFNGDLLKVKTILANAKIGPGYAFYKKPDLTIYGVAQAGLTFFFGYQTARGANGQYVKEGSPIDKVTVFPEVGATINNKLNIALAGTLPVKTSFISDRNYFYKISQASLIVRYVLTKNTKKN